MPFIKETASFKPETKQIDAYAKESGFFAHKQIHILVPFAPIRFCPAMSYV